MKAAPRPCTHPGCGRLAVDGGSRCALHPRPVWGKKPEAAKRVRGRHLQKARARLFAAHPLCVQCLARGFTRPATQRDHVIPLEEGGRDDDSNVQALCRECHDEKSLAERIRGAGGAPRRRPPGLAEQLGLGQDGEGRVESSGASPVNRRQPKSFVPGGFGPRGVAGQGPIGRVAETA